MPHSPLVLSGMQPTNTLHLGNYLGALKNWVRMQDRMPCLYCVVDMHAITTEAAYGKPKELTNATREVAAAYIAAGIDPKRSPVFNQGQVPEHAELSWIFNCVARLGWLDRMTQFKEKSGKHKERSSVGLYTYPVLMAADILIYKATHVPVGEDQKQHLELSRDIAQKFNNDFNAPDFFQLPEPVITGPATRVMSLRDGTKKMSKSEESDLSRINLTDDAEAIALHRTGHGPGPGTAGPGSQDPDLGRVLPGEPAGPAAVRHERSLPVGLLRPATRAGPVLLPVPGAHLPGRPGRPGANARYLLAGAVPAARRLTSSGGSAAPAATIGWS